MAELVLAVVIAVVLTLLLAGTSNRETRAGASWFWAFLVFLFVSWALALWAVPVGPIFWGVAWIAPLFGALLVFFLIAALTYEDRGPRRPLAAEGPATDTTEGAALAAFNVFFWVFLTGLALAVLFALF